MSTATPSLPELRKYVEEYFQPKPYIYWADFLISIAVAWVGFVYVEMRAENDLYKLLAFFVSNFALFRATLFIHEITHLKDDAVKGFTVVWNLLCGIPTLYASFLYKGVHIDHHKRHTYGTPEDGEYLPLGQGGLKGSLLFLAQVIILPFPLVIRFGLLAPLSWLIPPLRKIVLESVSSLAINFKAKRAIPDKKDYRELLWQEILCFLWVWFLVYAFATGIFGWHLFIHWYSLMVFMLLVNSLRTLVAHRYTNPPQHGAISFEEQLLDSVNVEGTFLLTALWAPVGLRFHALHHLFPNIPYHSLGAAHRSLLEKIPADHIYRRTIEPSFFSALRTHIRNTQSHP